MHSPLIRFASLLLAMLMLLSLAACGTGEQTPGGNGDESDSVTNAQTEAETPDPNYTLDLEEGLNYDTEVVILYVNMPGRTDVLECEKLGGGVISDAVYERNVAVEERLGIEFGYTSKNHDSEALPAIANLVQAGDKTVDLFTVGTYMCMTPTLAGHYLNLNALDNIDLSKHYWNQDYNEMMTFTSENLQYVATSPIALSIFRRGYITIFNRDLFADHQIPDLYETVFNGEWTLDYQYSLIKDIYVDSDGDGNESAGDFYGFVVGAVTDMDVYAVSSDIHLVTRDENGEAVYNGDMLERLITMGEKVSMLANAPGTYLADSYTEGFEVPIEKFAEKKAVMATVMFDHVETYFEDLANITYGIAPIPKLTKDQDGYGTYIQDQVSCFGISAAIGDDTRQEQLAATLEAMSYYSYNIVRPAYYDSVLSLRFMQDPQSRDVLNTMFDSISFDFVYATSTASIRDTLRGIISQPNAPVASSSKQWERQVQSALRTQQKAFDRLLEQGN